MGKPKTSPQEEIEQFLQSNNPSDTVTALNRIAQEKHFCFLSQTVSLSTHANAEIASLASKISLDLAQQYVREKKKILANLP